MSTTYHRMTEAEFETFAAEFDAERVQVSGTKEYVYDVPTERMGIVVRIFSTLDARNGDDARDCGRDAIRTLAYSTIADCPLPEGQATRTHRIETWAENLRPKVADLLARVDAGEWDHLNPTTTLVGLRPQPEGVEGVVVGDLVDTRYGRKFALETPYEAKDAIKALDWEETHRSWDSDHGAWLVDALGLNYAVAELRAAGWEVFEPAPETDADPVAAAEVAEGDHVTVTYAKKNGNGTATKAGEVEAVAEDGGKFGFRRDDGQFMMATEDGLFTSGSAYPFVGDIEAVEVA